MIMTSKTKIQISWDFYGSARLSCEFDFSNLPKLPDSALPVEVIKRFCAPSASVNLLESLATEDLDREIARYGMSAFSNHEERLIEDARLYAFDQGYDARSLIFDIEYVPFHGQQTRWVLERYEGQQSPYSFLLIDDGEVYERFSRSKLRTVTQLFEAENSLLEAQLNHARLADDADNEADTFAAGDSDSDSE
jgi:hypothetical protein